MILKMVFSFMHLIPPLNRMLEKGPRASGMIKYQWEAGLPFLGNAYGGICLPQVYCAPISSTSKNLGVSFTDDVIFRNNKKGLFQLLVLLDDVTHLDVAREAVSSLNALSGPFVFPNEATFIVQKSDLDVLPSCITDDVYRLATAAEFSSSDLLCKGRPAPKYYDMYQMGRDLHHKRFAIVRPDYFVYAACDTVEQLRNICNGIPQTVGIL